MYIKENILHLSRCLFMLKKSAFNLLNTSLTSRASLLAPTTKIPEPDQPLTGHHEQLCAIAQQRDG